MSKSPEAGVSVIEELTEAGVVTADSEQDDIELTDSFHDDWQRRIEQLEQKGPIHYLALLLGVEPRALTLRDHGGQFTVSHGNDTIGEWPSEAAILADVAVATLLLEWWPAWADLDGPLRDELLARFRVFLETCPDCEGEIEPREPDDTDRLVPQLVCSHCDAVLL